jgi:SAM-dependent methyltransferase
MAETYGPHGAKSFLHLGCGRKILEGHLNVDFVALPGVDAVVDLGHYPWPFEDNAWRKVIAHHVLEHLSDILRPMREMCRILAPGGVAHIRVPHVASWGAWSDPTHRLHFTRRSFDHYQKGSGTNYYFGCAFSQVEARNLFGVGMSRFLNILMNPIVNTRLYDWWLWKIIPCAETDVILVK